MGNAGSNNQHKEWSKETTSKAADHTPSSPTKDGEAFTFDKKTEDTRQHREYENTIEDGAPYYTKAVPESSEDYMVTRERSNTLTESNKSIVDESKVLPTVFKWEGGGKQVILLFILTELHTVTHLKG